jgi:hypothetical protein
MSSLDVSGRDRRQASHHAFADEAAQGIVVAVAEAAVEQGAELSVGRLGGQVSAASRGLEASALEAPEVAVDEAAGKESSAVTGRDGHTVRGEAAVNADLLATRDRKQVGGGSGSVEHVLDGDVLAEDLAPDLGSPVGEDRN